MGWRELEWMELGSWECPPRHSDRCDCKQGVSERDGKEGEIDETHLGGEEICEQEADEHAYGERGPCG